MIVRRQSEMRDHQQSAVGSFLRRLDRQPMTLGKHANTGRRLLSLCGRGEPHNLGAGRRSLRPAGRQELNMRKMK
jgi:hypothetical protein